MKIGLYIALLCLAMVPAYAQNAASQDRHAIGEATTTLVPDYADRLNGLLRDIHATLQTISERMEAGALTPQQARKLKLAATQSMIARLETLSVPSYGEATERCELYREGLTYEIEQDFIPRHATWRDTPGLIPNPSVPRKIASSIGNFKSRPKGDFPKRTPRVLRAQACLFIVAGVTQCPARREAGTHSVCECHDCRLGHTQSRRALRVPPPISPRCRSSWCLCARRDRLPSRPS